MTQLHPRTKLKTILRGVQRYPAAKKVKLKVGVQSKNPRHEKQNNYDPHEGEKSIHANQSRIDTDVRKKDVKTVLRTIFHWFKKTRERLNMFNTDMGETGKLEWL